MARFEVSTPQGRFEITAPDETAAMAAIGRLTGDSAGGDDGEAQPEISKARSAVQGAVQGGTFNFGDELQAALNVPVSSIFKGEFGNEYDKALAERRASNTAAQEANPGSYLAGEIGGALVTVPATGALGLAGRGAQAATRLERAAQGARVGTAQGAAYGVGGGEDLESRVSGGLDGALVGGLVGGAIGGVIPGPRGRATPNTVASAADRLSATGAPVQVPKFAATESMAAQRAAQGLRNVPGVGNPVVASSERAIEQLGGKLDEIAQGFGGAQPEAAGASAAREITGWIRGRSGQRLEQLYDDVERHLNPAVRTELQATRNMVADVAHENTQAGLGAGGAINFVRDAVQRSGGLTYAGIRRLRTRIGEMLDDGTLPAETSQAEFRRLYGALSQDLRAAVENAGGQPALARFEIANATAQRIARRREDLASIVGSRGDASAREVFERIKAAATGTRKQDTRLLQRARAAVPREDWNDMAAGVINTLGRKGGEFNPHQFMKDYNALSQAGRQILFGTTGRGELARSLDDISTISRRFQEQARLFGNSSGTAQNANALNLAQSIGRSFTAGAGATGAMMLFGPVKVVTGIVGAHAMAHVLSSPATARSMARWSRVYDAAVRQPTRGSLRLMQQTSRQFGDSLSRALGVDAGSVARQLQGAVQGATGEQGDNAEGVRNDE